MPLSIGTYDGGLSMNIPICKQCSNSYISISGDFYCKLAIEFEYMSDEEIYDRALLEHLVSSE